MKFTFKTTFKLLSFTVSSFLGNMYELQIQTYNDNFFLN